jgi:hypothetical protein
MNSVQPSLLRPTRFALDTGKVGGDPVTAGLSGGRNKEGTPRTSGVRKVRLAASLGGDLFAVDLASDEWPALVEAAYRAHRPPRWESRNSLKPESGPKPESSAPFAESADSSGLMRATR